MRVWYTGIADSEGLESFFKADTLTVHDLNLMCYRTRFNSRRNAVVYRVLLPELAIIRIQELMEKHRDKRALAELQKHAAIVEVEKKGVSL